MLQFFRMVMGALAGISLGIAVPALAQQDVPNPPDPYVHAQTGAAFPAKAGPWSRTRVTEYQDGGIDISAGYALRNHPRMVVVTLYVYPRYESCDAEFAATLEPIDEYTDRRLGVDRGDERFAPFGDTEQRLARFSVPPGAYGFDHPRLITDAWLACPAGEEWLVKMRASYEAAEDEALIRRLIERLDWSSLVPAE